MMTGGFRKTDSGETNKYNKYNHLQAIKIERFGNRLRYWSIRVMSFDYSFAVEVVTVAQVQSPESSAQSEIWCLYGHRSPIGDFTE